MYFLGWVIYRQIQAVPFKNNKGIFFRKKDIQPSRMVIHDCTDRFLYSLQRRGVNPAFPLYGYMIIAHQFQNDVDKFIFQRKTLIAVEQVILHIKELASGLRLYLFGKKVYNIAGLFQ